MKFEIDRLSYLLGNLETARSVIKKFPNSSALPTVKQTAEKALDEIQDILEGVKDNYIMEIEL